MQLIPLSAIIFSLLKKQEKGYPLLSGLGRQVGWEFIVDSLQFTVVSDQLSASTIVIVLPVRLRSARTQE